MKFVTFSTLHSIARCLVIVIISINTKLSYSTSPNAANKHLDTPHMMTMSHYIEKAILNIVPCSKLLESISNSSLLSFNTFTSSLLQGIPKIFHIVFRLKTVIKKCR